MKSTTTFYLMLLVGVWMAAGCRGPYSPVVPAEGGAPSQARQGVTMLTREVRDAFLLRGQSASRTLQGQIRAQVTMQNVFERDDVWCEVQFMFFDATGTIVEKSEWQNVSFPARELVVVAGNSLRVDAKSFNIQFRNLRTSSGKTLSSSGIVFEKGLWFESILPQ